MADEVETTDDSKVSWLVEVFRSSRWRVALAGIVAITWIIFTVVEEAAVDPGVLKLAERAIYTIGGVVALHIVVRTVSKWKNGNGKENGRGDLPRP